MTLLLWNVALASLWVALTTATLTNVFVGLVIGYAALWLVLRDSRETSYFRKPLQAVRFIGFFLRELAIATVRIAYDVVTPTAYMRPAVVAIPLDAKTDAEIALLAIVVTLTPGTLALDVSSDRRTLYVHAMYARQPEAVRREIKRGFERRVLELLR